MKRPVGLVRMRVFGAGRLLYTIERSNLFVNAGLPALAALLGGDTTGQFASAIGFGSGSNAPTVSDTGLTAPAYYKAIDSHSEDGNGSVTFDWSLTTSDTGADGITIQELALFANHASVGLPGTTAPAPILARKTISPIVFGTGMSLSGSWTLTF
ncbi:MAG TPA: hypothetical protein VMA09_23875 [Candidatus Binataceae bacterium]|nr:hypothetical protein [Candidatus Binataceae bacterium]